MATTISSGVPRKIRTYEIQRILGKGGMGEVHLATHELLDRPVAVKRYAPPPDLKDRKVAKERFLREGKALARLNHQGIVGIHDMFEHRGELFMVIEYVDGYDLDQLGQRGSLPLDIVCIVGLALADALTHAHFHGIIHRDVKSSNVMISRSGQIKLMDFGIARGPQMEKITQTGILVGTPKYLAPESMTTGEQTELGDIYGIGAVMYHCLSGHRLYYHANQQELYKLIQAGKFVPLSKVAKHVPRSLRSIVHKCLARKPEQRYQTPVEVCRDLDLFMASHGMWSNRAERLAGFLKAWEQAEEGVAIDSVEISDLASSARGDRRRLMRGMLWAAIGLMLTSLGAFVFWGLLRLGWLQSVLEALTIETGG